MNDRVYWLTLALELDRIGMRRRSCATRLQKKGRHAVCKINRAVGMKLAIEESKRCNILAKRVAEVRG